jgi:hypothetical protein
MYFETNNGNLQFRAKTPFIFVSSGPICFPEKGKEKKEKLLCQGDKSLRTVADGK